MTEIPDTVTIKDIRSARRRLEGKARVTPLLESSLLNQTAGRRVLVKAESLQRTGSFKFRGGWSAVSALTDDQRARGVIAYSSGNHAQGVAHAAELLDVPAVIVMPSDAPALKIENTRAHGAEVVLYDRPGGEDREEIGQRIAEERGLTLIRPFDNAQVIAGQGSCGLELAGQARAEGVTSADVLVCCGGGGLSAGIAVALAGEAPGLRVRPVQPEGSDAMVRSLAAGERRAEPPHAESICDALMTPYPGVLTYRILDRLAGPGLVVSDTAALNAMAAAFLRLKLVAEPGGAVALTAALDGAEIEGEAVICIITGGNVDAAMFRRALDTM